MPISINHLTRVIYVPQDYLTSLGGSNYGLDVNQFRLAVKVWEASEVGETMPDAIRHNTEVTLAGITFARTVEIINGYSVEFEDGIYSVTLSGANTNLPDVLVLNGVSVRSANSAGMIVVGGADPSVIADAVFSKVVEGTLDFKSTVRLMASVLMGKISGADSNNPVFRNTIDNKNRVSSTCDDYGNRTSVVLDAGD